jgi:hypothetical protein
MAGVVKRMSDLIRNATQSVFGHEGDMHYLLNRARHRGVTAIVGRALSGKTWTMLELARRLTAQGDCLVGYHEWTGLESSHLRYAVADLYRVWLEDASFRRQARMLWEQYKSRLVPAVGEMVGFLFEKLHGEFASDGVAGVVSTAFAKLAEAQKKFADGEVAPLLYEDAKSLTALVAYSGRK